MSLELLDLFGRKGRIAAHGTEGTIALMASGPTRNLRHFRQSEAALADTVELVQAGKGDMSDIEVEAHADCIRCDQIIDFPRLKHRHLGIARARAERAHDNRRAT